ncbi:DUF1178 family protein [Allopusillimonas soli]|uniref:DUF1178 family protein n=1 Tax=Allopusillimonas soli TaxID=659016 RepID=A0A853FEN0_9BURK|nr:DUF1178 family protein [Allopusillimonas soli]NYT38349.1 DUF1178 family protein [Allopusillimonas soli]TEA72084.1 DUF1178 family protein [Allopusillimonas soli]
MALKVYDLQCDHGHVFEGWFGSEDNYETQRARGLLSCPVCDSTNVQRKLSAPRLNVSHLRAEAQAPAPQGASRQAANAVAAPGGAQLAKLQAEVLRHIRGIIRNTENVGDRFAQEARRMHEGEVAERAIRGTATPSEQEALAQEGIAIMPIPAFLDDDRLQ